MSATGVDPGRDRPGTRRSLQRLLALGVAGTAIAAGAGCAPGTAGGSHPEGGAGANASVVDVVDGDTVVVDVAGDRERVRLIGIDTPESVAPDRPVECFGPEAAHRLRDLLPPGTPVRLERDLEARDLYGRLLAYVYRERDSLPVNLDQIARGYATASPYPPNTAHRADYTAAERRARDSRSGLWGACRGPDATTPAGPAGPRHGDSPPSG